MHLSYWREKEKNTDYQQVLITNVGTILYTRCDLFFPFHSASILKIWVDTKITRKKTLEEFFLHRASGIANDNELVTACVINPLVATESRLVFDGQAKFSRRIAGGACFELDGGSVQFFSSRSDYPETRMAFGSNSSPISIKVTFNKIKITSVCKVSIGNYYYNLPSPTRKVLSSCHWVAFLTWKRLPLAALHNSLELQ